MPPPPTPTPAPSGPDESLAGVRISSGLKGVALRSGTVTMAAQLARFALQIGSNAILGRLLAPSDFGLVAMVTAVTGILGVLRDAGLTTATVQRETITRSEVSTLFWFNLGLGVLLAAVTAALAPGLVVFYREPQLFWVTLVMSLVFVVGAMGLQHQALLSRQMKFTTLATIDLISAVAGLGVAVVMAWMGWGYWSLVGMPLATALVGNIGLWWALPWRPGRPARGGQISSMLKFGGYLTGSNVLHYLFRNADNVLIGRYWGSSLLGFYSRAYGLLLLPVLQVNAPIGNVAIATLSRLQSAPDRFRRYFVGAYSIAISITLPAVVAVTIFADEVVLLILGAQWVDAVELFRLLAPAAFIGALLNPMGWLLVAGGHGARQFRLSCGWAVLQISGFVAGLPFGPEGVAISYSLMSILLAVPVMLYVIQPSTVRVGDVLGAIRAPVLALLAGSVAGLALKSFVSTEWPLALRAVAGCGSVVAVYGVALLWGMRQWAFYRSLGQELFAAR